jgi:hypothetical protein
MSEEDKTKPKTEGTPTPEDSANSFEQFVRTLSPAQLAAAKATVETIAAEQEGINLGRMNDNEARAAIEKKYGFSPNF